jgi:hypothetical protein
MVRLRAKRYGETSPRPCNGGKLEERSRALRPRGSTSYEREWRFAQMGDWRKRLGVEPSLPDWRGATDFEDREGHRAPFASPECLVGAEARA